MALKYTGGLGKSPGYQYSPPVGQPTATGGTQQPASPHGPRIAAPRTIKVKGSKPHTRTIAPKAPAAPPGNPDHQALINAAVRLRYGPQEQALTQGLNQNARFSSGIGDWYKNAQDEIRALQAQGNANSQATLGRITSYASQPTLPNATDQQAAGARNNLNAEFATQFGRDATANNDAMNRLNAAYAIQQGNTLNQANADRQQLIGQQGALGQQKADYGLQYGTQLASAEQKSALDQQKNQIAAQALGLKVDTLNKVQIPLAQSLQQNRVAGQKVARSGVRVRSRSQQETAQQNRVKNALDVNKLAEKAFVDAKKLQKGGGSNAGNGRYTKSQLNHYDNQWRGAVALATHLQAAKTYVAKSGPDKGKTLPVTRDVAYSALLKEYKNDPEFAAAAADLVYGRSLSAQDLHVLATKGVHPVKNIGPSARKIIRGIENAPSVIKKLNAIGGP